MEFPVYKERIQYLEPLDLEPSCSCRFSRPDMGLKSSSARFLAEISDKMHLISISYLISNGLLNGIPIVVWELLNVLGKL